jgi:hypothetical protein
LEMGYSSRHEAAAKSMGNFAGFPRVPDGT